MPEGAGWTPLQTVHESVSKGSWISLYLILPLVLWKIVWCYCFLKLVWPWKAIKGKQLRLCGLSKYQLVITSQSHQTAVWWWSNVHSSTSSHEKGLRSCPAKQRIVAFISLHILCDSQPKAFPLDLVIVGKDTGSSPGLGMNFFFFFLAEQFWEKSN